MLKELICSLAVGWAGSFFYYGVPDQCAVFVRYIFKKAGFDLPCASTPDDYAYTRGLPQGPAYANSLAGREIGSKISYDLLAPGDIVFFSGTYGTWPSTVITHVGIYVGDGKFIHRASRYRPIQYTSLSDYGHYYGARRPKIYQDSEGICPLPYPTPIKLNIK